MLFLHVLSKDIVSPNLDLITCWVVLHQSSWPEHTADGVSLMERWFFDIDPSRSPFPFVRRTVYQLDRLPV